MSRLRSGNAALGRLLAASPNAIYAIDAQRRIVFSNAALGDLIGLDGDQLLGQRCHDAVEGELNGPAEIAASLCPPPEVFAGQSSLGVLAVLCCSGKLVRQSALHIVLGADQFDNAGVLTVLTDPVSDWGAMLKSDSEAAELHRRLTELRYRVIGKLPLDELIGVSPAISRVRDQIQLATASRTHVVVCGPKGSGPEHVAKLIHQRSLPQGAGPVIPLSCPLMDAELLQETVRAFSRQFIELPRDSWPTLLLVEVDQLSRDAQSELAGFFQLPKFELFTVATAERSLLALAEQGKFHSDLAEALSTLVIQVPSLVDRRADIPLLCQAFLERFNMNRERQLGGFSSEAMDELVGYSWPENTDELAEVVDESCRVADGPFVEVDDLSERIRWAAGAQAHPRRSDQPIVFDELMAEIEKELIERALRRTKGNKTRAAALLGMSRARLHRRIEFLGLGER